MRLRTPPGPLSWAIMEPTPELEGIINFRDVGKTINNFLGNKFVKFYSV
jgi:hypothetical protein